MTAIASLAATSSASVPASPPLNLDVEKAQCEVQLSDWVHCVSASTPEGKAKIEALSSKLDAIKAKQEKADAARADVKQEERKVETGTVRFSPAALAKAGVDGHTRATFHQSALATTQPTPQTGSRVDVYA